MASDLKGWTEALFSTKIGQLTAIIRQMNGGKGPDILGVCEVENAYVLQQLTVRLNGELNNRNYGVVHVDSTKDHRGIDTAFVYDNAKYTVNPNEIFSHFVMRRTGTRDMPVTAIGDFNDDPFDESILIHARATRERGDAVRAQTAVSFYNLA